MEGTGEISDTDSGIILHSGSDSPTTHTKDVTTHTRAMKLKHQALQDRLEICILELKKLCLREAELTGRLSEDYPLVPGEKPPQIRQRVGAAFKLDEQNLPRRSEDSELSLVDADLALQMKICEASRKLCEEDHLSKAVKKSRLQQFKTNKKKLEQLQEKSFQLRLERGRASPIPPYITQDLGTSDDSSLSDSVVQDEEVTSQSSHPSSRLPYAVKADPPPPPPLSTHSSVDGSHMSRPVAPQSPLLNLCQSPCPSLDSNLSLNSSLMCDPPPIQHSPWTESSLDQPYQKSKKSRSSTKISLAKSEVLPPLEACVLPQQLSHLRVSSTQSNSTPSTPEMRVHRQLSLRLSNPESSFHKDRGRNRGPRRRLTEYEITLPETPAALNYGNHPSSEDSNSEKSFSSYSSSPCYEFPSDSPKQYMPAFPLSSPVGSYRPQASPSSGFHCKPRYVLSPGIQRAHYNEEMLYPPDMARNHFPLQAPCTPDRHEYWYKDTAVLHQRAQRPPDIRLHIPPDIPPAHLNHPHYSSSGLPRQIVNEHLMSWHLRSQLKPPRSRSLDRQGAIKMKSTSAWESSGYQTEKYHKQVIQRGPFERAADESPGCWVVDDGSHFISQV